MLLRRLRFGPVSEQFRFLRSARINMIQAGAASRIAEMEAMKRNIAQAESEIKQSQQGYRAYQNRSVKTPADEALDTELNQRFGLISRVCNPC